MWTTVLLPCLLLAVLGWVVPMAVARALPQSLPGLVANGAVSAVVLLSIGAALFAWLYGPASGTVWQEARLHFVLLSARAMIVWGPLMVLSLAQLPRRWPPEAWEAPGARDEARD